VVQFVSQLWLIKSAKISNIFVANCVRIAVLKLLSFFCHFRPNFFTFFQICSCSIATLDRRSFFSSEKNKKKHLFWCKTCGLHWKTSLGQSQIFFATIYWSEIFIQYERVCCVLAYYDHLRLWVALNSNKIKF